MSMSWDGKYPSPHAIAGIGANIGWCSKQKGRKKCDLCFNYAPEEIWKEHWHFYYLFWWRESWGGQEWCYHKERFSIRHHHKRLHPRRYITTGLRMNQIRRVLTKGCPENKNCLCMNFVQRGFWYCPNCWKTLDAMADFRKQNEHDLMIMDRKELKSEVLILRLSGVI